MKKIYLSCVLCFSIMLNYAQSKTNQVVTTETTESIVPFIDKLKNGEHFTIHYKSSGCFHNSKEALTFERTNNTYYVVYKNEKKQVSDAFMERVRSFEKELSQQHDLGCTTVDNYLVIYNDTQRIATDGSCSWNGYSKLKKLFGFTA
ncbi:MAG: hypothetical protein AB8B65_14255 [Kordia sp.]|uniref:hypothetical protein n=1 Tax=Kordia sp. TaxID=1965332 RepID=UPI003859C700